MVDDRTVAHCVIDHLEDGPDGAGFYYSLSDAEGNETDPIGPFESKEAAETAFMTAMEEAAVAMIKEILGLED